MAKVVRLKRTKATAPTFWLTAPGGGCYIGIKDEGDFETVSVIFKEGRAYIDFPVAREAARDRWRKLVKAGWTRGD